MELDDLELYRNDGYIDLDEYMRKNPSDNVNREARGSEERDKDWIKYGNSSFLVRTEMFKDENNLPLTYSRYAELIIEELAKQAQIPSAHYDLVKYKGQLGVMSQNVVDSEKGESLITALDLINSLAKKDGRRTTLDKSITTSIDDLFSAYKYSIEHSEIESDSQLKDLNFDTAKIAIFDVLTMNTDRNMENLAVIYKDGEIRMSPIFDNECSLMLDIPINEIAELLENRRKLENYVDYQLQLISIPEKEREKENLDWEDLLYYLCDNSPKCLNFAQQCINNLDIEKAMDSVEKRTRFSLPDELKKIVNLSFDIRVGKVREVLDIEEVER